MTSMDAYLFAMIKYKLTINSKKNDLAEPWTDTIARLTRVMTFMWRVNCSNQHRTIARDDKPRTRFQDCIVTRLLIWKETQYFSKV
jgi:hypothetical protein